MQRLSTRSRRQALYGWLKWMPILALLFSVMFFDAWLNIRTRNNDYRFARLSKQIRELCADLGNVRVQRADKESYPELASLAPDMGLVKPEPKQVTAVYHDGAFRERVAQAPIVMARTVVKEMAPASTADHAAVPELPVQLAAQPPASPAPVSDALSSEANEEAKLMGSISVDSPASL